MHSCKNANRNGKADRLGMKKLYYSDDNITDILDRAKTIAMVGTSTNSARPSYLVMQYLQCNAYRVIPVNPVAAGTVVLKEIVYASLADIPGKIDMVDIFRNSDAAGVITDEAISLAKEKSIQTIWMQLGVRNDAAAQRAEAAGLTVVMDRCPKIEIGRLYRELNCSGVKSRIIAAKRSHVRRPQ